MTAVPTRAGGRVAHRRLYGKVERATRRAIRVPLLPLTTLLVRRRIRDVTSVDDALDLAYDFRFAGVNFIPWQERAEIRSLLVAAAAIEPQTVLEIGTSNGGSLSLFARIVTKNALIVSVDLPHGKFGGGYPRWRGWLYRSFAVENQHIRLLRADSHRSETLAAVQTMLGSRPVDVLFIDGDHTYEGVKRDFEMYGPLVRRGGMIAFHDIVPTGSRGPKPRNEDSLQGGDVPQFWAEIRNLHDVTEFVDDWDSGRFGIGLITVA